MNGHGVSNRPEWKQALSASVSERNEITRTMTATLSAADLKELVQFLRSGTQEEKDTALRLLGPIVRSKDAQRQLPQDWQAAAWAILREETFSPSGTLAWHLLLHVDRDGVNDFLMKMPVAKLSEAERLLLIGRLCLAPRTDAFAKFREIEALGGREAGEARRQRENLGGVDDDVLEALAADWRRNRTRESLNRLYNVYVSHLSVGAPLTRLVQLLGPPRQHAPHDYRWVTNEDHAMQLAVFTDADGRVDGWKLK